MRRGHLLVRGLMAVALIAVGMAALPAPAGAAGADSEWQFVERINELRAGMGLGTLTQDAQLTAVARRWSATMASSNRLFHNNALPRQVDGWVKLGENVGMGASVDELVDAFAASPPHLEHLIDPAYTLVGVGVVEAGGVLWVTEEFERPAQYARWVARPSVQPAVVHLVATHGQVVADAQPRLVTPLLVRLLDRFRAIATGVAGAVVRKRNN